MMRRRMVTADAVVAWRTSPAAVTAALAAEGVPAAVGPAEGGWTRARLLVVGDEVVEPRGRTLVDLLDDLARTLATVGTTVVIGEWGARELLVVAPGRPALSAGIPAVTSPEPPSRPAWSAVLGALGATAALEDVLAAATPPAPVPKRERAAVALADDRPREVARSAGLPPTLLDPGAVAADGPDREVVLARSVQPPDLDVVAGAVGLPLHAARLDQWTVVAADPIDGRLVLPVAGGLSTGRRPALLLWRQGEVRGYQLIARSDVLDSHVWDDGWQLVELSADLDPEFRADLAEALSPATGDADLLVRHVAADPDLEVPTVRALLRRPPDDTVLRRLCEVLGIDSRVVDVVEGAAEVDALPGAWAVRPATGAKALWAAASAPRDDDPALVRAGRVKPWWWRLLDLVWVVAAAAWTVQLWSGGGAWARTGAVLLAGSAVWSLYDAVSPAAERPSRPSSPDVRA